MNTINSNQSIGEIVTILPNASEIFKQYKIDFCCGGGRPLIDAIKEQNLNEGEILNKLQKAFIKTSKIINSTKDFKDMSPTELIEHIVNTHHVYVKKTLPEIAELTSIVLRAHGANHGELFKVHKLFSALKGELEQHLIKEEEILFPLIQKYDSNPSEEKLNRIKIVVNELEDEHEAAGGVLKELRKITGDYSIPQDGCNTYAIAYSKLEELEADLFQHIHLENNILFKGLGIDVV